MIAIRPIWLMDEPLKDILEASFIELVTLEKLAIDSISSCYKMAQVFLDAETVNDVLFLERSANSDLVAGCELARAGYLKQAYSLWRSWFEQSIFALYFLEAPIHRIAWKVSEAAKLDDNPQYRLMLHQLINNSGERHPFGIVYGNRFDALLNKFKITGTPKDHRPIVVAGKSLTQLSQGVHGTYQPTRAASNADCGVQVKNHGTPALNHAFKTVLLFWVLFLTNTVDLPEEFLILLREGNATDEDAKKTGLEFSAELLKLSPIIKMTFPAN